jgi:hypothetical protein
MKKEKERKKFSLIDLTCAVNAASDHPTVIRLAGKGRSNIKKKMSRIFFFCFGKKIKLEEGRTCEDM